jgi:ankyrin repeat protein
MTGRTCLEIAIVRGHFDVIEFILQRVPSTALISNSILGRLPLHNAVLSLNFRVTKLLVEIHPEALKHADFEGYLPLHMAAQMCQLDVCQLVFTRYPQGLCLQAMNGRTPLMFASQFGNIALVDMILFYCIAAVSTYDENNLTKMLSLTSLLLSHPIHNLEQANFSNSINQNLLKMKNISSVQSTDEFELTALHLAAFKGYSNIVLSLLNSSTGNNAGDSYKSSMNSGFELAQIRSIYMYIYIYIHIHIHIFITNVYIDIHLYTYMYIYVQYIHIYIQYTYTHKETVKEACHCIV